MLFSDYGTPKGWIHMNSYGCHTFGMVNAKGERHYVKWHWRCHQSVEQLNFEETEIIQGRDPDASKRELYELIENGGEVKWTLALQVMTPEEANNAPFDAFDVTKVWPRKLVPMIDVGVLTLNRNPEDYHRDVEQAAFSPGSLVPGIELSPDTLLQWRAFFYRDAQYQRLQSANIHQIPVNCPFMSKYVSPDNFFGSMRMDGDARKPVYFPNSYHTTHNDNKQFRKTPGFDPSTAEAPWQAANNVVARQSLWKHEGTTSEYDQVRDLYLNVMTPAQRENLHKNTAKLLSFADGIVQKNYLVQMAAISPDYAKGIFDKLPEHKGGYTLQEINEAAKEAHLVNKDINFKGHNRSNPKETLNFMGMPFQKTKA